MRRSSHIAHRLDDDASASRISPHELAQLPPGMLPHGRRPELLADAARRRHRQVGRQLSRTGRRRAASTRSTGTASPASSTSSSTLRRGEADLPRFQGRRAADRRASGERRELRAAVRNPEDQEHHARRGHDGLLLFALAVLDRRRRARRPGTGARGQRRRRRPRRPGARIGADRQHRDSRDGAPRTASRPRSASSSAVGVAIALSPRFPISQARRYDLDVGFHADWLVLGIAAAAALVAVLAIAIVSALWTISGRRGRERVAVDRRADGRRAAGLPPALAIGSRLAVEPGRGRRAVPVRSALIGAIVGVLGVVGCFTFRAGLADAATSPQRSGIVWNYVVASGEGPVPRRRTSRRSPTITTSRRCMHATWVRNVRINGVTTPTWAIDTLKGDIAPVVLTGRAPTSRATRSRSVPARCTT